MCPRIWVSKVYVQDYDENQWKKFQLKNLTNKKFFAARIEKKCVLGNKYKTKEWNLVKISAP
jgi:hypothetical protein